MSCQESHPGRDAVLRELVPAQCTGDRHDPEFMGSHLDPDGDPSSPCAPVKNREGLNCRAAVRLHRTEGTDPSHKSLNILTVSERFFFLVLTLCGTSVPAGDGW